MQPAYRSQHCLPVDLAMYNYTNFTCTGHPKLCKKFVGVTESGETPMISSLMCELRTSFDLTVNVTPCLSRNPETPVSSCMKLLVVRASHACRLADQLASMASVQSIAQGGWRAGKNAAAAVAVDIMDLSASYGACDYIILQIFDNTAIYARTCENGLIPCRKEPVSGMCTTLTGIWWSSRQKPWRQSSMTVCPSSRPRHNKSHPPLSSTALHYGRLLHGPGARSQ